MWDQLCRWRFSFFVFRGTVVSEFDPGKVKLFAGDLRAAQLGVSSAVVVAFQFLKKRICVTTIG